MNLEPISEKINEFFIKNFYALGGVGICKVDCKREDFKDSKRYKALRKKIADEIELLKFKKFDLQRQNPVLEYDKQISNQTLCPICNIRKVESSKYNCKICNDFVELGKKLTFKEQLSYQVNYFDDFKTTIALDEKLKSYVLKNENNSPITFKELAKNSCKNLDSGIEAIGILKADVDSMGDFLKDSDITDSIENFDTFSKTLDNFFSIYISQKLMKDRFKDTYTVFAGGDDLFLVGSWDEILDLSRQIRKDFKKFDEDSLNITFLYRLLNFCEMSKRVRDGDIKATIWRSKLNYIINRNIDKKYHYLIKDLDEAIKLTPKETKIFLSEFIYKRRDR